MAASLVLAGCAVQPPSAPPAAPPAFAEVWTLQGRIGVQHGEDRVSGQLYWHHRAEGDELLMTSPLGQGVARIVRDADGVVLELPNQPARRAADVETLTRETLGYGFPVAGLVWWVRARPVPAQPFEAHYDDAGRMTQLRQSGWVIDYLQYDAAAWPRRLLVVREGLQIRLVADSWLIE